MLSEKEKAIFDRARNPLFSGHVEHCTASSEGSNASCGDEIRWEARIHAGSIEEIRHTTRACAVCTASADFLAERLTGQPARSILTITPDDLLSALSIPLSPVRTKCALLPLESATQLLEQTEV